MTSQKKLRVAVVYGGRSTEHEVSLRSAASVVRQLDRSKYDVTLVAVDTEGRFRRTERYDASADTLPIDPSAPPFSFAPHRGGTPEVDVVFPVVHGPLCEDGSLQGLLELADLPYVGSRVLGSAVCMDKDVAKRLVQAERIAIAPYVAFHASAWQREREALLSRITGELGDTWFVKPATLGSSVGVSRVEARDALPEAVQEALRFDEKILVERAIDAREVEVAVLASEDPAALPDTSIPGEIVAREAFYSFERKYLQSAGADLHIPARIDADLAKHAQTLAQRIFLTLECEGMARVDFFLDRGTGELIFNEVNTLPGFTSISMYPKLWEASGLPYPRLLDRLLQDAIARHARRSRLRRQR
jgi:D-alanine-D-alanine ligase